LPSPEQFLQLVSDFWFHAVWAAKHLRRGELWRATWCCNAYLKDRLLRALEWHAQASGRLSSDASLHGHFLEKWVDPRAAAALPQMFAHYDEDDVRRALLATMSLFRWVARDTAEALGYSSPDGDAEQVRRMVTSLFT
jgi:aminoglycoside 6-adenylyltransferase